MSYDEFIRKWTHPDYPPRPCVVKDLERVEARFAISLPVSYKKALLAWGAASATSSLLRTIVDKSVALPDVQEFVEPREIIEHTEMYQDGGLSPDCVIFAYDCMGNAFCFRGSEAVWFFDHDLGDIGEVAPNFEVWIDRYCALEPTEPDHD